MWLYNENEFYRYQRLLICHVKRNTKIDGIWVPSKRTVRSVTEARQGVEGANVKSLKLQYFFTDYLPSPLFPKKAGYFFYQVQGHIYPTGYKSTNVSL